MKYDDGTWHSGGDFPADLPEEAGCLHIAVFLAWAVLHGLGSEDHTADELAPLAAQAVTPVDWFLAACDGKLTDEDLSDEGNAFALAYYADEKTMKSGPGSFIDDYERCFPGLPTLYHAPAGWIGYGRVAPLLSRRLEAWRRSGRAGR